MLPMTHANNIYGIRVNSISSNGSINFGNVIHKGHQANIKANVGNVTLGDKLYSPTNTVNRNIANDPDVADQAQKQI